MRDSHRLASHVRQLLLHLLHMLADRSEAVGMPVSSTVGQIDTVFVNLRLTAHRKAALPAILPVLPTGEQLVEARLSAHWVVSPAEALVAKSLLVGMSSAVTSLAARSSSARATAGSAAPDVAP